MVPSEFIRKNIIRPIRYIENLFLWYLCKKYPMHKLNNNQDVLYIPCDPWSVWGSRGDEAMILASMKLIKKYYGYDNFTFITSTQKGVEETQQRGYKAIKAWKGKHPIYHITKSIRKLNPARIVIIGADCMDGYYSPEVSFTLMACADICYQYHIPYHLLGFSFNEDPSWKLKLAYALCTSSIIFNLRDYYSKQRFENFTHKKARLVADMAFLLEPNNNFKDYEIFKNWHKEQKENQHIIVGFNFHPMLKKNQSMADINKACITLAEMIVQLLKNHNRISFIFIPHDNRGKLSDTVVLPIIANEIRNKGYANKILEIREVYHADQIKSLAQLCDIMICSRMHLAIGALSSGIPIMAATYQGKFHGLFKHYNLPENLLLTPEEFLTTRFINTFEILLNERTQLMDILKSEQPNINKLSKKNII